MDMIRVFLLLGDILFLAFVLRLVANGRLLLKYSLMWLFLGVVGLLCIVFPQFVYACSDAIGFITPSNFVLLLGIALLLAIALSLTVIVSRLSNVNRALVQRLALLEKEQEETT